MPVMCSQNWNYIKSNSSQGSAGGMNFLPDNVVLPISLHAKYNYKNPPCTYNN